MEADPRRHDYRKARRRLEFGPSPVCVLCGETNPVVFHHLAGEANDCCMEGPICLNCHALVHEAMRHYGVDLRHSPKTVLERFRAVLLGQSVFFGQLSSGLAKQAEMLDVLIRALNLKLPNWKDLKEAW